jgi:hypothetical protein
LFCPQTLGDWVLNFPDGLPADVTEAATKIVVASGTALVPSLSMILFVQDHVQAQRAFVDSFEAKKHHTGPAIDVIIVPWSAASEIQMAISLAALLHKAAKRIADRKSSPNFPADWRFHVMLDVETPSRPQRMSWRS